ncbi:tyrosine-type recombinase/integrase [Streptomyces xiamenensis]|uniref:tyrosine-type recombinase/integrase n=1 Tax=Streptomyces xiamenensis TaxID=408015 RepID=UPI0037D31B26
MTAQETQVLLADDVQRLTADPAIPATIRSLFLLLWEGEMRLGDILSADVRDVDIAAHQIRVDTSKERRGPWSAPISDQAATLLHHVIGDRTAGPLFTAPSGRPLSRDAAARSAQRYGYGLHAFRRAGREHRLATTAR